MVTDSASTARDAQEWPAVGFEHATWEIETAQGMSRRQRALNRGEYRAAVTPTIATQPLSLPTDLAADLDDATSALVRLDAHADLALESELEIAPLRAVLLRTESASSSQIEGLTVGARKLALAELDSGEGARADGNAALVLGNVHAMDAALALADEPSVESVLAMHRELMQGARGHAAGVLRTQQVWIGGAGPRTADFVPPLHERVPEAMADLAAFLARDDLPSLAHAALAHAQFETIHPFTDGNGRTGRALVHAMLRRAGTVRRIASPISAGLLTDPQHYFNALTAYRSGDIRPILATFARSSLQAAAFGTALVDALAEARSAMRARTRARSDSSAWRLIDLAIAQPVLHTKAVMQRLTISEPAAGRALRALEQAEVLRLASVGRRNRVWQCDAVLEVLDDFADRIRRAPL